MKRQMLLGALFLSLATGKWGAYIGIDQLGIHLIDTLFFLGLFKIDYLRNLNLSSLILFLFIATQIFIAKSNDYEFQTYMRDLLPFIYLFFVPLIARSADYISTETILRILKGAALINAAWSLPAFLGLLPPVSCSMICGVPLFTERSDQSGIACAIGILAWGLDNKARTTSRIFSIMFLVIAIALNQSRAGLLSVGMALFVVLYFSLRNTGSTYFFNFLKLLIVSVVTISTVTLGANLISLKVSEGSALSRLIGADYTGEINANARGTVQARFAAQSLLLNWTHEKYGLLLGAGAGTEMVANSGSFQYLSGALDVRAPHSWWVNCISRFGLLGMTLWLISIRMLFMPRFFQTSDLTRVLSFACLCLLVAATFGVLIESPFGSLPLAILLGILKSKNADKTL
jgi:O-Antigen ligase